MKLSSSFSGFCSTHTVPLLISELLPKPDPSSYHISPSGTHGPVNISVSSATVTPPAITPIRAITNPVISSKPRVSTNLTLSGFSGESGHEPSCKRQRVDQSL